MMKWLIGIMVFCLFFPSVCSAAEVGLAWDSNIEDDMQGYKVYQSPISGQYSSILKEVPHVWDVNTQTTTLMDVPSGTWFWVVTAYDTEGFESGFSNEVSTTIEPDTMPPANPTGLDILEETPQLNTLIYSTFEDGDDGWGGVISLTGYERDNTVTYAGQYSMRVFATGPLSHLSIDIKPENWVLDEYPFVRFAYKIPNGVPIGLFFHTTEGWVCLGGTSTHSHGNYPANDIYTLIDDDAWHEITIDVRDIRSVFPVVNSVDEFEWFTASNAQLGDEFWFDEFMILGE